MDGKQQKTQRAALLTRVLALTAAFVTAASLGATMGPSASAVSRGSCEYVSKSQYPGSAFPPRLRYAEVEVYFTICGNDPSEWKHEVTKQQTNATGKNLGFFLEGVSLKPVDDNKRTRDYLLTINAATCTPRLGWPCSRTYSLQADIHVNEDGKVTIDGKKVPMGMALYNTP